MTLKYPFGAENKEILFHHHDRRIKQPEGVVVVKYSQRAEIIIKVSGSLGILLV